MKLYSFWRSSSSWRVRIALHYKGLAFETVAVDLRRSGGGEHRSAEYRAVNPLEQVPALEVEEHGARHHLTQSIAIIEYLEERFPEPPLLPGDRYARARARQFAEVINS